MEVINIKKIEDEQLIGQRVNMLIIKDIIRKDQQIFCYCLCDCGNYKLIRKSDLFRNTKSCGCYRKERAKHLNRKKIEWTFQDDYVIEKTNNQSGIEFFISIEDYEKCKDICWHADYESHINNYYIRGTKDKQSFSISHYILDKDSNYIIDHKNHNTTDNRRENLRIVSSSKNAMNRVKRSDNTSGVTGVTLHKVTGKWQADICVNRKHIYLGLYSDVDEAIKIRKQAEEKYFGEYSFLNSIKGEYKNNENCF